MTACIAGPTREAAKMMRALLAASLCAGWALHGTGLAHAQVLHAQVLHAQAYPNRPIRMVVPFPPGGPTDAMARIISDRLGAVLGQTIVVENRGGGAGGSVGAKAVATADPDGYTILITPGGSLTTGPAVHSTIGYDPAKAFVPVGQLIETPLIMSVYHELPVKSLAEVVAYAKANPGKISWGSQGFGTAPHLLAEMFKLEADVNIVHVPYRGTAPMLAAIVAGEIQMVADPMTTSLPHIESGKLRPLAIAGAERSPKLPDVPTTPEAGYPKLQAPFWLGVVAPAGTPPAIVDKLNAALHDSLAPPETRAQLANLGAEIKIGTPADFGKMLADELAQWTAVVKAANIKVE
jgi:tripartite-type tricarboxylate transporter receptor subunit TctC